MDHEPNIRIWKSFVFYRSHCFFISTIERTYDTCAGSTRGQETIVWKYDWDTATRGDQIHQAGHICDHQAICRCLINTGKIPDDESEEYRRFT